MKTKTALIIPAYKPDMKMIDLLKLFEKNEDFIPVVVDDGSGEAYENVFQAIPEGVEVLRHEVNRGKGAALKTAIKHVLEEVPQCEFAVTADADGQHKYEDILRVVEEAHLHPQHLILGSRAFDGNVPFRSRFGNAMTRQVFAIASGAKVRDTQTGLRAFGREAMQSFIDVPGERYEYEINMLLHAARNNIKILEVTIETIYIDDNASSHFNPIKDSLKIYACILKFAASSLIAFGVETVVLLLMNWLTAGLGEETSLLVSAVVARLLSSMVNFFINRSVVFCGNEKIAASAVKYAILALGVFAGNYLLLYLFNIVFDWSLLISSILFQYLYI